MWAGDAERTWQSFEQKRDDGLVLELLLLM
jgi:hypothetical protein